MNRVLYAFNDIQEQYISEAAAYKASRTGWIWGIAACLALACLVGAAMLLQPDSPGGPGVQTPQKICAVGETLISSYGVCEYVACTDTTVTLRVKSTRSMDFDVDFFAYKTVGTNQKILCVATTGYYDPPQGTEVLKDALVIYIDGEVKPYLFISADGQEHEVVIDFSLLLGEGYEMEDAWYCRQFGTFDLL